MSRYEGKPFLKLLDSYVLKSIGHLTSEQEEGLRRIEPMLAKTYATGGSWFEIVAKQMDFPPALPGRIMEIWTQGSARMRQEGLEPDPVAFTLQFVDTNFPT